MTPDLHLSDAAAQRLLDGRINGLLDPAERAAAEAHLARCPACQALVDAYQSLEVELSRLREPAPPQGFTRRVLARIEAHERSRARERHIAASVMGASALATAASFALAGPSAWAQQISAWVALLLHAGAIGRVALAVVPPLIDALWLDLALASGALSALLLLAIQRLVPASSPARSS